VEDFKNIIKWIEDRIEYHNYEYRYSDNMKIKETIDTKRTEANEILRNVKKLQSPSTPTQCVP